MFVTGQRIRIINFYSVYLNATGIFDSYTFDGVVKIVLDFDSEIHYALETDIEGI